MDASSVLLALDEQKKWRERRKRIRDRLRQLDRRRDTLRKELEGVRKKILEYTRLLTDMRHQLPTRAVLPPRAPGARRCLGRSRQPARQPNGGATARPPASRPRATP